MGCCGGGGRWKLSIVSGDLEGSIASVVKSRMWLLASLKLTRQVLSNDGKGVRGIMPALCLRAFET
jgi:hypothetical protein